MLLYTVHYCTVVHHASQTTWFRLLSLYHHGMGLQSLLVDYAQITAASLTMALNDTGPLGQSIRALLSLQHRLTARQQILHLKGDKLDRKLARNTRHLHLLRQLCLLKDCDIKIECPSNQDLSVAENHVIECLDATQDLPDLQESMRAALVKCMPALYECGIATLDQVLHRQGDQIRMRPASSIKSFDGLQCSRRHKIAYNRLTLLLSSGVESKSQRTQDLTEAQRTITDENMLLQYSLEPPMNEARHSIPRSATPLSGITAGATPRKASMLLEHVFAAERKKAQARKASKRSSTSTFPTPAKCRKTTSANMPLRRSKRLAEQHNLDQRPHAEADRTKVFHTLKACSDNEAYRALPRLAMQELEDNKWNNVKTYTEWLQHSSSAPLEALLALYNSDLRFADILDERTDRQGKLQYLVSWIPCSIRQIHVDALPKADTLAGLQPSTHASILPDTAEIWVQTTWKDSWEADHSVHQQPESTHLFKAYMERQTTRRGMTRQDHALPMEERQGHNTLQSESGPCIATRPDLKRLIIIDPMQTHNPDTDRLGSGHFCIQHPAQGSTSCTVHMPSGHTAGPLPLDRVQLLYRAFTAQEQSADSTFEAAVAQLLIRSRPARAKGARPPGSDCPGAPTEIITALHIGLQLQIELFSSPLTFGFGTRSYYSSCTADAAFGANLDCYARVWGGFSYCSLGEDDKDMDKAVRWAIASAQILQQPSLTAFILPAKPSTAYTRWLDHSLLHTLLDLSLVQASEAQHTAAPRRRSRLGRSVFIVANKSALALIDMVDLHENLAACSLPGKGAPQSWAAVTVYHRYSTRQKHFPKWPSFP